MILKRTDSKLKLMPLPDLGDVLFILLLQLPLFAKPSLLFGDGSTGWHLVSGDFILKTHTIPHFDLISYTFPNQAWVAYEWLSDTFMAWLVQLGELNLLAVAASCSIGLLFLLLYDRCREEGANFLFVIFLILLGAFVSAIHWLARPVLFTFFGVYLFSNKLEGFYRGTISGTRLIISLCFFMLLWVNTHPGFLFGFALIVIYLGSAIVNYIALGSSISNEYLSKAKTLLLALIATLLTCLINPYGLNLFKYIVHYLKGSTVLAATDEFASPIFHGGFQSICLELLFFLFVFGLAASKSRLSLPRLLTCLAFAHLSLTAIRNMPLFAIVVLPAVSQLFSKIDMSMFLANNKPLSTPQTSLNKWHKFISTWNNFCQRFDAMENRCKMHIIPCVYALFLTIVAINGGRFFHSQILTCGFDPLNKPTATLEYIHAHKLDPKHGMNFDNWGGYIKYKLGIPVFIDDRADFYSESFYREYGLVSQVEPGWKEILKKREINWLLFPKNSRIVATLKEDANWQIACEDGSSTLMVRK